MGYLKYQLEEEQISFGNGEWFFTGNKRKTDKVAGRYTSSEGCEGKCNECNIVTARYSNGETYSIPYDCNAANSYFNFNSLFEINDYAPISAITSLEFGDCVTSIDGALYITSFDSLTSITFSNSSSLKAIGGNFRNVKAPKITEIRFPSSLRILDNKILAWDMPNLERVILNDGIKWIGNNVFSGTKIRELVIPSTVEHLGSIEGIKSIEKVTFISETPPKYLGGGSSSGGFEGAVYVPCGSVNEYKQAFKDARWYNLVDRITCEETKFRIRYTMSDGLKASLPCNDGYVSNEDIKDFLDSNVVNIEFSECTKNICANFSGFTSLNDVSLTIPNANICRHAFENTSGITSLTIGSGCTFETTNATESTFANMPDLRRVTLEEGLVLGSVEDMFENCTSLSSITIPNSVTSIGNNAFRGCSGLTSLSIGNGVKSIGYNAFMGCTSLTNVTIPTNVKSIDSYAFNNCKSLTSVTVEALTPPNLGISVFGNTNDCPIYVHCDSVNSYINSWPDMATRIKSIEPCNLEMMLYVTYIESSRLDDYIKYCDDTSMYIPNSDSAETVTYGDCVTSIDNNAFENKYNLKSVTISNSVTSIGNNAFEYCSGLTSVSIGNSVTSIGNYAFHNCNSLTSVTIPNSVESIGDYGFDRCISLSSVTIGSGVTSIGNNVFSGCRSITSVTIPDSVTSIGSYSFSGCSSSTSITIPDSVTSIGDWAFFECSGLTNVAIPNSVTSLGTNVFNGCISITKLTIGSGITRIRTSVFERCSSLTSITIPDSVTSIGDYAFYKCSGLTSITIPDSVTSIGASVFSGCRSITSVTIPDSVTSIGEYAFNNCKSLTSITVEALTPPNLGDSAFSYTNDCPIYVPAASVDAYKAASGWRGYASRIKPIPNS